MSFILVVIGALVLLRTGAMLALRDVEVRTVVHTKEVLAHEHRPTGTATLKLVPPVEPRPRVRARPPMRRDIRCMQWRCECGGVETVEQRALKMEHACSRERWI